MHQQSTPHRHPAQPQVAESGTSPVGGDNSTQSGVRAQAVLRRYFPDFEPVRVCDAVLPLYLVRFEVEVLERHELSIIAAYLLQAISLGLEYMHDIGHYLGLEEEDLAAAATELLSHGLIDQLSSAGSVYRRLYVTLAGTAVIGQPRLAVPVPRKRTCRLHYNPLTQVLSPVDDAAWTVDRLVREGTYVLPVMDTKRPTLGDFTREDVAAAVRDERAFAGKDILDLLSLGSVMPHYLPGVVVYEVKHRATGERRIAAFRHHLFLAGESQRLQRQFEQGSAILAADAATVEPIEAVLPTSLPPEQRQSIGTLTRVDREAESLAAAIDIERQTDGEQDRQSDADQLHMQIVTLEAERAQRIAEVAHLRAQLAQHQVEFLRTEDHRAVLERALAEAREEIIIISPWMNRRACNDTLCRLISGALQRGVQIRIGYGMGQERDAQERDRNIANVNLVLDALRQIVPDVCAPLLELRQTRGTHQKILIWDRQAAVNGSFNWLSYLGERDAAYRNETGTVFRHPDQVLELVASAESVLTNGQLILLR